MKTGSMGQDAHINGTEARVRHRTRPCSLFIASAVLVTCGSAVAAPAKGTGDLAASVTAPTDAVKSVVSSSVPPLQVVTSFTLLADVVKQVGGDRVAVTSLVGPNSDAHGFSPAPKDAKRLAQAQLVVMNGWGFDEWMHQLAHQSHFKGRTVRLTDGLSPLNAFTAGVGHGHDHVNHGSNDPHAWQDVRAVMHYTRTLSRLLCEAAPTDCPGFEQRAVAYQTRLQTLHQWIEAQWRAVPAVQRVVFTSHAAYRYYGQAYGVTFHAVQGVSTESEPSAKGMASLVRQIRATGARAVFLENISNPKLMQRLAAETGARVGGTLYSDALSPPEGPVPTYVDLMTVNTQTLLRALAP